MYDLSLLKSLLNKENYLHYRNHIKDEEFVDEVRPILFGIDTWWKTNTETPLVEDIVNLTFSEYVPEKSKGLLRETFIHLASINGQDSVRVLLEKFKRKNILEQLSVAAYNATNSRKGSVDEVLRLASQLSSPIEDISSNFVTDDIIEILDETVLTPGLRWRLTSLNKSLGSLRKGDFGFIFARPETGKTTFIADQTAFMAGQLKEEDGPILWFNNEEQGKKVRLRSYEAALGQTVAELLKEREKAKEKYLRITGGKLRIYDSANITKGMVQKLCTEFQPSLVVIDQIDKTKGFEADRTDLEMGAIYQWWREIAKSYAPVIGCCQADGTAEGEKWLHMGHVSLAKTAKQAEADFIIGIGRINVSGYEKLRFINISKNKLVGDSDSDPQMRHGQIEVLIQPQIARYEDV